MSVPNQRSKPARVLVTGPADRIDDYIAAAREVGWEALPFPLLTLVPRPLGDFKLARKVGLLCVTSASALPWIAELVRARPKLVDMPVAVVGERSARGLQELGWRATIDRHDDAESLAVALATVFERGGRVLWPRGDRSDALAQALREAGADVQDPIAYENRTLAQSTPPPAVDAVFLASPSAVHAWCNASVISAPTTNTPVPNASRGSGPLGNAQPATAPLGSAPRAIVIGPTTLDALLEEKNQPFAATITLPDPTPEAFRNALAHLDP